MKRLFLLMAGMCWCLASVARTIFSSLGNVGIATTTFSNVLQIGLKENEGIDVGIPDDPMNWYSLTGQDIGSYSIRSDLASHHNTRVNTSGADFVFDSTYHLPSLHQLHNFIKSHHHLPGILPASVKQDLGINLGMKQTKLLQKIEELTLYVIAEDKENQLLQQQIDSLRKEFEKFKNRPK